MSLNAKLAVGTVTVAIATAYLAYLGASSSWRYYVHVDECVEGLDALQGCRLRVNGRVGANSLQIRDDRRLAHVVLRGERAEIRVSCTGLLPDNLTEEMDVVVEGTLEDGGLLRGDKVLTRCASKYEPSKIASTAAGVQRK
jgi:cytochrome c-type biogenesis protein CcmE